MNGVEHVIYILDGILNTRRKRHIIGGLLLSASFMFGGLALTVITIRNDDEDLLEEENDICKGEEEDDYEQ